MKHLWEQGDAVPESGLPGRGLGLRVPLFSGVPSFGVRIEGSRTVKKDSVAYLKPLSRFLGPGRSRSSGNNTEHDKNVADRCDSSGSRRRRRAVIVVVPVVLVAANET